jgi:hypothetical protein
VVPYHSLCCGLSCDELHRSVDVYVSFGCEKEMRVALPLQIGRGVGLILWFVALGIGMGG